MGHLLHALHQRQPLGTRSHAAALAHYEREAALAAELIANRRLADAASDLLQACAIAQDWMRTHGATLQDMAPLQAAIDKALIDQPEPIPAGEASDSDFGAFRDATGGLL